VVQETIDKVMVSYRHSCYHCEFVIRRS